MMKLLHIAETKPSTPIWTNTFCNALKKFGTLEIISNGNDLSKTEMIERIRSTDILLTSWGAAQVPAAITKDPGNLKYICHVTGELHHMIPLEIIRSGIPVTNWGNSPAFMVAEGAMVLLLAILKNLRGFIVHTEAGSWWGTSPSPADQCGSLRGLKVGLFGLGFIGRAFCDLLRPFRAAISAFDPYAGDWPDGVKRVESLEELFQDSHAVVIHAGLTSETRKIVNAKLLSLLPDHGIVINTARGGIIDQDALFAELENGRLRAALDVLDDGDMLPADHPARQWPNLILTCHQIASSPWPVHPEDPNAPLQTWHEMCLENLQRFASGQPLQFVIDETRYSRMS